jgi:hypothetical protein
MATTDPPSTDILQGSSVNEAGSDTKSLAGGATTKRLSKRKTTQTILPTNSKLGMESESSDDSSTSGISTSSKCAKKQKKGDNLPTEGHLKIRAVVDAGSAWELDLERVHGLTDEEACIVVSKMAPYVNQDTFPENPSGDRFMTFAKQGWEHMRKLKEIRKKYPECRGQTCVDGKWIML